MFSSFSLSQADGDRAMPGPAYDRLAGRDVVRLLKVLLLIVGFTFFSGGMGFGPEQPGTATGHVTVLPDRVLAVVCYLVWCSSAIFVLISWQAVVARIAQTPLLWGFTLFVLASSLWSISPDFVQLINREVMQMSTFALFVVVRFSFCQQLRLITFCFGLGAVLSALMAIGLPSFGPHTIDHVGAWKGIYDYKNILGSIMIMGLLSFYLSTTKTSFQRWYRWAGCGLCVGLIWLCTSKTSLLLSLMMVGLVQFLRRYRWWGSWSIALTSLGLPLAACSGFLLLANWVMFVDSLGKDPTISGRTQIWSAILYYIWERPFWGFGRGAFWESGSVYAMRAGERVGHKYIPPHGHNEFLDLLLDVGFIGLILFCLLFFLIYSQSLWLAYYAQSLEDYWPASYLTFLAINNVTESFLIRLANPYWVLFLVVALNLPQLIKQRQEAVRDGPIAPLGQEQ